MADLKVDEVSRLALIALQDGRAATLEEAVAQLDATRILILSTSSDPSDRAWQAATVAAAELAARCFGSVTVAVDPVDSEVIAGPYRGESLAVALGRSGTVITNIAAAPEHDISVVIGSRMVPGRAIHASWSGWVASASPEPFDRPEGDASNVVTAIAAAALAIGEAFHCAVGGAGSDAGFRVVNLDLWGPNMDNPAVSFEFAPAAWWLVGLGHLGQANAFVISQLPYRTPADVEVVVQDIDVTSPANHGTSVLTPRNVRTQKTRLVASAIEAAGQRTRIIERRMSPHTTPEAAETGHVALIGVDNVETRRLVSGMGWARAIDAGLGHRASNYQSISLHSFPGPATSDDLPSWQGGPAAAVKIPDLPGFADLRDRFDECGVIEVAGKAVGVPFVGMIAATLVVTAAIREVLCGEVITVRRVDLKSGDEAVGTTTEDRAWEVNALPVVATHVGSSRND